MGVFKLTKDNLLGASELTLTALLLVVGAFLIGLAMIPKHPIEKAIVLAWVLLP